MKTLKYEIDARILVRRNLISSLRDWCFAEGLDVSVSEDKRLLSSHFRISVFGANKTQEQKLDSILVN